MFLVALKFPFHGYFLFFQKFGLPFEKKQQRPSNRSSGGHNGEKNNLPTLMR
jgi:hypothetical protein